MVEMVNLFLLVIDSDHTKETSLKGIGIHVEYRIHQVLMDGQIKDHNWKILQRMQLKLRILHFYALIRNLNRHKNLKKLQIRNGY